MRQQLLRSTIVAVLALSPALAVNASASDPSVQLGPRPFYLVDKMSPGPLKTALQRCGDDSFKQTTFSIGHRGGAPLQFPEHTKESHEAGARMGAGILECDVTFTRDGQLVCRHDQCDLHTTTNILVTDLAQKCSVPFSPAVFYYQTTLDALENDGDIMVTLDVLAKQVGILGIFSDWSATVTYYANCMGLK